MRLINASTMIVEEFAEPNIPPYGILSHTWEGGEVSYEEMRGSAARNKKGYDKIDKTCKLATADGLAYVWVDTCCIDKSSSAELTEAINSMFQWYKRSATCYVYLSDLKASADVSLVLKHCRWFRRGWTLQELIAPREVSFFDQNWNFKGRKAFLLDEISAITGIGSTVLNHTSPLSSVTVATRMSWAARRETTREEDAGYCLLGIFDVNMPLLYGEGLKAFKRLQEEIIKSSCDLSIFAWTTEPSQNGQHTRQYSGILAESAKAFSRSNRIIANKKFAFHTDFSVTNRGIRIHTNLIGLPTQHPQGWLSVLDLGCAVGDDEFSHLAVCLRKCGADLFVRDKPSLFATIPLENYYSSRSRTIYIISKLPESPPLSQYQLAQRENNLIIGSRTSAVQIRLPQGFRSFNANPAGHFDSQDGVFFSTEDWCYSWCFMQFKGEIFSNGKKVSVSCFFLCLNWSSILGERVSTIFDKSSCDLALLSQFLSALEHEQHDIVPWVMRNLDYFGISIQNSVALKKLDPPLTMSHTIRKVFLPNICSNEMYEVDITLA
jgi:hypothetical protein